MDERCGMKRIVVAVVLLVCAGCCGVSEEAKELAWGIVQYQKLQVKYTSELTSNAAAIENANVLLISSNALLEILGEPETKPDLPGIVVTP